MRLNNKTVRNYLFYSSVISLLTIPLFYFVIHSLLLESVDDTLRAQLLEIRSNLGSIHSQNDLAVWTRLDRDIVLTPTDHMQDDRLYVVNRRDEKDNEEEPYREIVGVVNIGGQLYQLVICRSLVENDDLLGSILMVQVGLVVLLIAGTFWINQRISKRLWRPFYMALKNLQLFELNKHSDLAFKESTTDEFNELNKAIRNLFARSTDLFAQQKEFTENASHEMQTPLAIFQSKLELLIQTRGLSEEQAELIGALDDTNRRLIRLNKSLLLLTKIENDQYRTVEEMDVASVCQKLVRQYQVYADEKNIVIYHQFHRLPVRVNGTLLEILIGNLLSNAIRYNRENGEIFCRTGGKELVIENTGSTPALHPERIFDRFYKQASHSGKEESIGLGLAIVKNICMSYHYTVSYSFLTGRHSFKISFDEPENSVTP